MALHTGEMKINNQTFGGILQTVLTLRHARRCGPPVKAGASAREVSDVQLTVGTVCHQIHAVGITQFQNV